MFSSEREPPNPSGLSRCATAASAEWMVAARDAVSEPTHGFWHVHGDAAKVRCAPLPLDEAEMLGLLGAGMFGPSALLKHDDANPLGNHVSFSRSAATSPQ